MKIVVLAGGNSPEREVSLCSGKLIADALILKGHKVALLDLSKDLEDIADIKFAYERTADTNIEDNMIKERKTDTSNEIETERIKSGSIKEGDEKRSFVGKGVLEVCKDADVVFMALHGSIGENGKLQAMFDLLEIKYTGTGAVGSMLAMDKQLSKELFVQYEINTPKWLCLNGLEWNLKEINDNIGFPCVVKPVDCGSSIGVKIVTSDNELVSAMQEANLFGDKVIIEEMIQGREFSVGILDNQVLPAIEIIPKSGFYDYNNKYQAGKTLEICPADISEELESELETAAKKVHDTLRLGYYSRVDILVDKRNILYVLEANTLPGMTKTSLLPQEAKAVGISFEELCEKIAVSALH